jgi:hypothetical protein
VYLERPTSILLARLISFGSNTDEVFKEIVRLIRPPFIHASLVCHRSSLQASSPTASSYAGMPDPSVQFLETLCPYVVFDIARLSLCVAFRMIIGVVIAEVK